MSNIIESMRFKRRLLELLKLCYEIFNNMVKCSQNIPSLKSYITIWEDTNCVNIKFDCVYTCISDDVY